jgi:site-specific recombinase XerD
MKGYNPLYWPGDKSPTKAVIPFIDTKKQLRKLANKAGLGEGRNVTPHMLRHTWATRHCKAGTTLNHLMELGGRDSYEMVLRYADVPQDLQESTDSLEQFPIGVE